MLFLFYLSVIHGLVIIPKDAIKWFSKPTFNDNLPFPPLLLADVLSQLFETADAEKSSVAYPIRAQLIVTLKQDGGAGKVISATLNLSKTMRLSKEALDELICEEVKALANGATALPPLYDHAMKQCDVAASLLDDTELLKMVNEMRKGVRSVYLLRMWRKFARAHDNLSKGHPMWKDDDNIIHWMSNSSDYASLVSLMGNPLRLPLGRMVGEGGYGRVYESESGTLGRVAVKVIKMNRDISRSLKTEIEAMRIMSGEEHFVTLHHAEMANLDTVILTMDFLEGKDGESFFKRLAMRGIIPPPSILSAITRHLLLGLKALHAKRLIHVDFKPANIFLTKDGRVIILDPGLALSLDDPEERRRKTATPTIMSPEYDDPNALLTEAVDIWNLAVSLIDLFAVNYSDLKDTSVLLQQPKGQTMFLEMILVREKVQSFDKSSRSYEMGMKMHAFISRCLKRDPAQRPLIDDLLKDPFIVEGSKDPVMQAWIRNYSLDNPTKTYDAENE